MLKGIDPRLNADVLHALAAMGHGDHLIVADANFPVDAIARRTTLGRPLHIDNVTSGEAIAAILSLLPLDTFIDDAVARMEVVGDAASLPAVQQEVQTVVDEARGTGSPMSAIERFAFYEHAAAAYCVIQTGERRFYGCFSLTKGVIGPEDAAAS
ncbi:RbsD/FucU family protein [Pararhizobium mangrovi]|uniref:Ribose ABC transporter n=1 Tax=Pararhizobium mangrovi TaxID=2590452 RepID=A0A506U694_9HYPH|nr:RbsD/FucU domain-containing protein [Pararhizobium mangrovi]TPW29883.1 ribose ABC transporter [Pararhizobium mangrovi]